MPTTIVLALAGLVLSLTAPAGAAGAAQPSFRPYVRDWVGHTRSLDVHRDHTAVEDISDGCCDHVIQVRFVLSDVRGTAERGSVGARVTAVRVDDPDVFDADHPAPQVGDTTRLLLRHGVLHEPLLHASYCDADAEPPGRCGA
jgi:hypothetical protein